jgi:hypothetical protein
MGHGLAKNKSIITYKSPQKDLQNIYASSIFFFCNWILDATDSNVMTEREMGK